MTDFYYDAEFIDAPNIVEIVDSEVEVIEVPGSETQVIEISTGPFGPAGNDGASFVVGEGAPTANIGINGDIFIDTLTGNFYGPKQSNVWPSTAFYVNYNQRFIFTQSSPSSTWDITHSLNGRPSVSVVDSADTQVVGEVQYLSNTQIRLSFTNPFSGKAYLT